MRADHDIHEAIPQEAVDWRRWWGLGGREVLAQLLIFWSGGAKVRMGRRALTDATDARRLRCWIRKAGPTHSHPSTHLLSID